MDSFYSFVGEGYAELNNVLYSFKDGKAYSHNSSTYNSFYFTYTSKIEIVSNINPSMVKKFEALTSKEIRLGISRIHYGSETNTLL